MMPTLVLLPGMDGTGTLFEPLLEALRGHCKTIVVSYPPAQPLGYDGLEKLIRNALPDEDYVLLAESFSGPLGLMLAAEAPSRLRGLILCVTFARNPRPWLTALGKPFETPVFSLLPRALTGKIVFGGFRTPARQALLERALEPVAPEAWRARLQAVRDTDLTSQLQRIAVPTLYLQAARDRLVPARAGRYLRRHMPRAEFVTLDAPHCLLQCAAEEAAARILDFLHRCRKDRTKE